MRYQDLAARTEAPVTEAMRDRLRDERTIRLLHAGIGLATEAGEILDQLKRHIFYGKELDVVNLKEEAGDGQWYTALLCNALEADLSEEQTRNIAKLRARYPDKFSEVKAENRDLAKEREILEGATRQVDLPTGVMELTFDPPDQNVLTVEAIEQEALVIFQDAMRRINDLGVTAYAKCGFLPAPKTPIAIQSIEFVFYAAQHERPWNMPRKEHPADDIKRTAE